MQWSIADDIFGRIERKRSLGLTKRWKFLVAQAMMQATPCTSFEQLPAKTQDLILQHLTPAQLLGIRGVSRRWRQAVDDSLGRRHHLHLTKGDMRHANNERLWRLLRRMPSLRRLTTQYGTESPRPPLSVDVVSRLLRHLVEVNLLHFGADPQSLEGLWTRCPQLEAVTMPRGSAERCAEVLLRRLPSLRRLDVARMCDGVTAFGLDCLPRLRQLRALDLSWLDTVADATLDRLHGPRLRMLNLSGCRSCSTDGVTQLVLGCPSLTVLWWLSDLRRTRSLVYSLLRQLSPDRDVTLEVDGRYLQDLLPLPPGPLRLREWEKGI
ncbi:uncharacterized protein LOC119098374 [Pollicipes pollicipes]|uniref:uncharacterized protein LOC119098374 n=1 Tax=Pollicipes pollicipes TaxID=41117 RepID=UPI001884BCDB|nr:uncharacterized protein LOC119098374 [Pollicipes pollicipes]